MDTERRPLRINTEKAITGITSTDNAKPNHPADVIFARVWPLKDLSRILTDSGIMLISLWAAFALRLSDVWPIQASQNWWLFAAATLMALPAFYHFQKNFRSRRPFDLRYLYFIAIVISLQALLLVWIAVMVGLQGIPRSVFVIYWFMALALIPVNHLLHERLFRRVRSAITQDAEPVILYGAGPTTRDYLNSLRKLGRYMPVALIDDKHRLQGNVVEGVKVYPRKRLIDLIQTYGVRQILLNIPEASDQRRYELMSSFDEFPVDVGLPSSLVGWPHFDRDEIDAVRKLLVSGQVNYWTGGAGKQFEKSFAEFCHTEYAISVANGTLALELAFRAIGLKPGDEVVLTSRTFIASASAIVMCGARPVFADVDANSQNITADSVSAVITPQTRAILAVHLAGWPCEMDPILELAQQHDLKVVEDCAQAHGARYKGKPVGSLGDIAAFSFCQDKIMTTGGEGGMVVTNNRDLWKAAWAFKDHGKDYDLVYNTQHSPGFRWLHNSFGSNYRMTGMQAAIGCIQVKKLPAWLKQRRRNADYLLNRLGKIQALRIPQPPAHIEHAYYKFYAFVRPEFLKSDWSRDRIIAEITTRDIPCFSGSCSEIYAEEAFARAGLRPSSRLSVATELGSTSLMFLVHPTLGRRDMETICRVVEEVMLEASEQFVMQDEDRDCWLSDVSTSSLHIHENIPGQKPAGR